MPSTSSMLCMLSMLVPSPLFHPSTRARAWLPADNNQVFVNTRGNVSNDRNDADSGTKYAVVGTMIDASADEDNSDFSSIFDFVESSIRFPETEKKGVSANLESLLPLDYRYVC